MKIIACYKLVPEEQDISVREDRSLDTERAEPKISPFDLNAVEAAVNIVAQAGEGSVTALSAGGKILENGKARKDILARGPDDLALVIDEKLEYATPYQNANVLAHAAQKIGFDLIICGDGSGDLYAQQVGILLGALLQVPTINAVSKIVSISNEKLTVERVLENDMEVLEIPLPAVIAVSTDINVPRIPAMKAILSAAKKPVTVFTPEELGFTEIPALTKVVSVLAPEQTERKKILIEGDGDEQLAAFVANLQKILN